MTRAISGTTSLVDDQHAAWELHVELATRISVAPLPEGQGLLTEALASLDVVVTRTRQVMREHGPHDASAGACTFQPAAFVIEETIGLFLARWRGRLAAALANESLGSGPVERERNWPEARALRADLEQVRQRLTAVADQLAESAGARSLIEQGGF
ncbi:hypothetical protein [Nocardia alni]|uniref:hypothetical protein n=1 Tax=Nocardia alni TaxID=2815723 RepID=UPI001C2424A0|nr:hypothetical protein [Nocardia alni]